MQISFSDWDLSKIICKEELQQIFPYTNTKPAKKKLYKILLNRIIDIGSKFVNKTQTFNFFLRAIIATWLQTYTIDTETK